MRQDDDPALDGPPDRVAELAEQAGDEPGGHRVRRVLRPRTAVEIEALEPERLEPVPHVLIDERGQLLLGLDQDRQPARERDATSARGSE